MTLTLKIMHRWLPMILILTLAKLVNSLPGTVPRYACQSIAGKYSQNETYAQNLNLVLSDLISNSSTTWFYNSTAGEGLNKVYALFYCRGDIGSDDCHDCVQGTISRAREWCPSYKEAIVWYEQCTLRYANRLIFSKEEEDPWHFAFNPINVTDPNSLSQALFETMGGLISDAAYTTSNGFSTGIASYASTKRVYCIVQCSPDIHGSPCYNCLTEARSKVRPGGPKAAYILLPSCRLMYDFDPLFSIANSPSPQENGKPSYILFKVALPVAVPIFFLCGMSIGYCLKINKMKQRRKGNIYDHVLQHIRDEEPSSKGNPTGHSPLPHGNTLEGTTCNLVRSRRVLPADYDASSC